MKAIQSVRKSQGSHWVGDGLQVRQFISPGEADAALSPFLLLDYIGPTTFPAGHPKGVGEHPHRGFETVTLMFQGSLAHRDSTGSSGVIYPGDVQWMTAASGVVHEEMHSEVFAAQGGILEGVQLWVNLPAAQKMSPPKYQGLSASDIPTVELPNGAGTVRVVAGNFDGVHGPASTFTRINLWDVNLTGPAQITLPMGDNAVIALLSGSARVNGSDSTEGPALITLGREGEAVSLDPNGPVHLLVLSGEPIDEPVASYGPFVMNTQEELHAALSDYRAGRMGNLE